MNVALKRLGICPNCDHRVLHDHIPLGTVFNVHRDTIRGGFLFICGGCGTELHDVQVIDVDSRTGDHEPRPLPLLLFEYPE